MASNRDMKANRASIGSGLIRKTQNLSGRRDVQFSPRRGNLKVCPPAGKDGKAFQKIFKRKGLDGAGYG